jgi:Domain of unknown function (DUF1998)
LLSRWGISEPNVSRTRLTAAMDSALQAILRAIATCKDIEERDVQGIIQPGHGQNGELGFVLFDDSTGGAGAVLDLVMSGDREIDRERSAMIRKVLQTAIDFCVNCNKCGETDNKPALMPLTKEELFGNQDNYRRTVSCYSCLRNHRNQKKHYLLDRYDAALLIGELLSAPVLAQEALDRHALLGATPRDAFLFMEDGGTQRNVVRAAQLAGGWQWALVKLPQGFAYGEWMVMDRQDSDSTLKRLRLKNGVGMDTPIHLSPTDYDQLAVWI